MSTSKSPLLTTLIAVSLILAACSRAVTDETTTSTAALITTTTSLRETTTTTTTAPGGGLDLSEAPWVTNGPTGLFSYDGTMVWATNPILPGGVARDRQGGVVFTDSSGLWWFQAGAQEPIFVREESGDLETVVETSDGPVAMVWDGGPTFYRLSDGEPADPPQEVPVEVVSETPWLQRWTAANGLSVWVTEPEIELDAEGQPAEILEPARLMIAQDDEVLVDVAVGSVYEEWARIHDFDGQTLILSRGPFEPALPEETFLVIDLAAGEVTGSFNAGATVATLTGADVEWNGPVETLDLGAYEPIPIATDEGVTGLDRDGQYVVFISDVGDGSSLEVDLAVWFSGAAANTAAMQDGDTDIPVANDYYLRNADPATMSVPVDEAVDVTSVWYDYDTDPDLENDPITYRQFLDAFQRDEEGTRDNMRTDPWWVTVEDGRIVALDEQYVP